MSGDYLADRTWQIHSAGTAASTVQDVETKTVVPTEIAQLYVAQDIRELLKRLVDRDAPA